MVYVDDGIEPDGIDDGIEPDGVEPDGVAR